jgi:Bacterial archaeo-eukaryotic release factor family 2
MIRAELLTHLYDEVAGADAVATAYLDATRSTEHGAAEVRLRWDALRDALAASGADAATLEAMTAAVEGHRGVPGPHGQVLVAAGGAVRYDGTLPNRPRRETARWAPLPHLMPLVAQLAPVVPHVLAVVDRTGGDLVVRGPGGEAREEYTGDDVPVHKASAGGWSELRYQHRTEKTWEDNARAVAELVDGAVRRVNAALVVLAGDVKARHLVREALGEHAAGLVADVDEGGPRTGGVDPEPLEEAVSRLVAEVAASQDAAVLDRYAQGRGQGSGTVEGLPPTVAALQAAQVDTLLVIDDPSATGEAWIGPEPTHLALTESELPDLGVPDPRRDRLDAALVRAAVGTHAAIVTLAPGQLPLAHGVGALLRY